MPSIAYDATLEALFKPERRATVFGQSPVPSRTALAIEAARLAYVRVEEGAHAREHLTQDLARAGFGTPATFDHADTGSQGFAALRASDGLALVAFRGTQSDKPRDLLTDLMAWRTQEAGWPGKVHAGFARAATALLPSVTAWLDSHGAPRTELLLCGHSLGAAIATLIAERMAAAATASTRTEPIQLITIGSPRVGNAEFASAFAARGIHATRIVDALDIVTRLPPAFLGYRHVGMAEYIDEEGNVVTAPSQQQVDADGDAEVPDLHTEENGGGLPRRLADHAPVNYLRAYWP